ncbi:hypothetical protein PR002_g24675 [Phytophthora rubi]|uniref:Uncharacterized protein n=1 Tax=Phytophthora rubi TaxID=129364 RepID=A0A6A3I8T6_9STRA|nr:hypothetical protein PR002_g24675 [Phytophthora rubi]
MVRDVSCHFLRLSCSEEDHLLFRREYASVSAAELDELVVCARFEPSRVAPRRPTGLGNLAGLARGAGGSAAEDQVGHGDDHGETGHDRRLEDERRLGVGESVALPASLFSPSGRRSSMESVWIRADRESDARQRAFPKVRECAGSVDWTDSLLCERFDESTHQSWMPLLHVVVNNCRLPKWYYNYDSSATRVQRDMTHHFVAYVLQLSGGASKLQQYQPQQQEEGQQLVLDQHPEEPRISQRAVVLASHASPSFLLISFRRSGSAIVAGNAAASLSAVDSLRDNVKPMTTSKMSPLAFVSAHHDSESFQNITRDQRHEQQQRFSTVKAQRRGDSPASARIGNCSREERDAKDPAARCGPQVDDTLWQQRIDADFSERGQQILVLWRFLQHLTLRDLHVGERTTSMDLSAYWSQVKSAVKALGGHVEGIAHCFLRDLFGRPTHADPSRASSTIRAGKRTLSAQESSVVCTVAHCFLRALSSRALQRRLHSVWSAQDGVPTKEQLHEGFVRMISSLYDAFDTELREVSRNSGAVLSESRGQSVPMLVDAVLSLVYGQPRFNVLCPSMSALLMGQQNPGSAADALNSAFRAFTAQARETVIASAVRHHRPFQRSGATGSVGAATQHAWNRRWLLQPSSVQVMNSGSGGLRDARHGLLLVDVAQLVCEFGCVDVTVGDDSRILSLRSALLSTSDTSTPSMDLVLDGHLRVFRVLPSGLSSMIPTGSCWSVGDYAAKLSSGGETLYLDLFAFAEGREAARDDDDAGVAARRVSLSMRLEQVFSARDAVGTARSSDFVLSVQATVNVSTFRSSGRSDSGEKNTSKLSEMPSSHRARAWSEMEWIPAREVEARYIPAARTDY